MTAYTDFILENPPELAFWAGESLDNGSTIPNLVDATNPLNCLNAVFEPGPVDGEFAYRVAPSFSSIKSAITSQPSSPIVTVSVWVKMESPATYGEGIFEFGGNLSVDDGFSCALNMEYLSGAPVADVVFASMGAPQGAKYIDKPFDTEWHHYMFVFRRTGNWPTMEIFLDGVATIENGLAIPQMPNLAWGTYDCSVASTVHALVSNLAWYDRELVEADALAQFNKMMEAPIEPPLEPSPWVTSASGLSFVRIVTPNAGEQEWADMLAPAINAAIWRYLGNWVRSDLADAEIKAAAHRAFAYAWKYREAPFGEAQWLDEQGGAVRLARDWIEPIKPILDRWRNVTGSIG